ncbi:hypothetical protein [Amycolatopsis sp. CA-230715]|uniref:hypothetical protein n=1 Tax=Amycolatopsis sp. CA-230715 TaxID=2745196 RepID=UPI001C02A698|nr:hypothetical protein [Amycolatopsis sp. CA-230715]
MQKINEAAPTEACTEPYAEVVDVTPVLAKSWLKNTKQNRPISKARVKHYARLIRTGQFHLNGETVKLDEDGCLLDGQHRCSAVVASGQTVRMLVVFKVARSSIVSIDMGRSRSLADQLKVAFNYKRSGDLSTIVRFILEWTETGWISPSTFRQITPTEAHKFLKNNPDVEALPQTISGFDLELVNVIMTRNQAAFLLWLFSQKDADLAKVFMRNLVHGIAEYEGDPCILLRRKLMKMRGDKYGDPRRNIVVGLTIQTWNKWRARKSSTLVRAPAAGQSWVAETFPRPN